MKTTFLTLFLAASLFSLTQADAGRQDDQSLQAREAIIRMRSESSKAHQHASSHMRMARKHRKRLPKTYAGHGTMPGIALTDNIVGMDHREKRDEGESE